MLRTAGETDTKEDTSVWGGQSGGRSLEGIAAPETRLAAIQAAKERLQAEQRAADDAGDVNRTESESEGRVALQATLWETRSEGAEQFHGSGERDHE